MCTGISVFCHFPVPYVLTFSVLGDDYCSVVAIGFDPDLNSYACISVSDVQQLTLVVVAA